MNNVLCILSRCPIHNPCKTRIAKDTSDEFARNFSILCLKDLINNVRCEDFELLVATDTIKDVDWFRKELLVEAFPIEINKELKRDHQTLMYCAFNNLERKYYKKSILLDMDIPYFNSDNFKNVFQAMSSYDLIVGPGLVGGFTFVAMNSGFNSDKIFKNVGWGTTSTEDIIRNFDGRSKIWDKKLDDLDNVDSIKRNYQLIRQSCPNLYKYLQNNLSTFNLKI